MERLTRKTMFGDYGLENETNQATIINRLGQLEDLEKELGIDLVTLFKAMRNGIYLKNNKKHCVGLLRFDDLGFPKFLIYKYDLNLKTGLATYGFDEVYVYDYGKTWELTEKEIK